jgi:hypothetical protein
MKCPICQREDIYILHLCCFVIIYKENGILKYKNLDRESCFGCMREHELIDKNYPENYSEDDALKTEKDFQEFIKIYIK